MKETDCAFELQVNFTYEGEETPALETELLRAASGKCIVLCGSSGCGKTTLLRCLNQLIPQFYEGQLKGFCRIGGKNLADLSIGETGRLAASVFQDPRSQFFTLNSSAEVAFGLENMGFTGEEIRQKVQQAFSAFHLESLMDRDVFSLSSGERQLVAILAAWALDTDLFLMDEPTANLDCHAIQELSRLLEALKNQGKTLLISEHRLYYLRDLADEYWFLENGVLRRKFTREEMLALTQEEREVLGLRAINLDSLRNNAKSVPELQGPEFCAKDIHFSYPHSVKEVLTGLSFSAHVSEVIGLIGQNGCGKTSFCKLASGLLKPDSGNFSLAGHPLSYKELQSKSIFIMQEAEFQFFTNSVMNELSYGRKMTEADQEEAEELLRSVGLWECRNRHPFSLSGGQMQRLVLLLACLSPKPIVVLDEPTAGLDRGSLTQCARLIRRMQQDKLVLIITHDLELIAQVCTRCCCLTDGKLGESFELTGAAGLEAVKACMEQTASAPRTGARPAAHKKHLLDPRPKIFIFLLALIAGVGTDTPMILLTFAAILLVLLSERKWLQLLCGILSMGSLYALYGLFPGVATAFLISFFPRMLVICFGALLLAGKEEASRSLAALRRLHMPESVIMVLSVTLRFFPVLQKDLKLMGQSIRTRGFFPCLSDKLRAIPQYLEILVVPMVFRVIRIAEALSASAETRGIALKGRRDSMIELKMGPADVIVMILATLLFAAGLVL